MESQLGRINPSMGQTFVNAGQHCETGTDNAIDGGRLTIEVVKVSRSVTSLAKVLEV